MEPRTVTMSLRFHGQTAQSLSVLKFPLSKREGVCVCATLWNPLASIIAFSASFLSLRSWKIAEIGETSLLSLQRLRIEFDPGYTRFDRTFSARWHHISSAYLRINYVFSAFHCQNFFENCLIHDFRSGLSDSEIAPSAHKLPRPGRNLIISHCDSPAARNELGK